MSNYILSVGLVLAMLALLAMPINSDEGMDNEMETNDEAIKTLDHLLQGVLQSRVDRSWRKPCEDNSCIQSGNRGWKRTNQRGSPFSMDNFKCVGEGCSRAWKRTPEKKR